MQGISWPLIGQAFLIALQVIAFFAMLGYWPGRILLRGPWARYRLALTPFVGWLVAVSVSYYLHAFLLNMVQVFWILVGVGAAGMLAAALRRKEPGTRADRWVVAAMAAGAVLFLIAVLPHGRADSLGLLGLNVDEELYYPYAEHIKRYTSTMAGAADGPFLDLFTTDNFRSRGQGFAYLLSLASILTRTPTFVAYMPLVYTLLGLSVVSVFVFARIGLGLGARTSLLAAVLYSLNGLPLWFSSMGFGPHTAAFALFPLALAALKVAAGGGQARPAIFAGWISAVLVASYFWAISAVFLVSAAPLVLILAVTRGPRLGNLKSIGGIFLTGAVTGLPALFWLGRWAIPRLASLTTNLNGSFGNAWGDLTFPSLKTSMGFQAYHMVDDPAGIARLLGGGLAGALVRLQAPAWWGFLATAVVALLFMRGDRLAARVLAVAFGAFMYWVWQVAGYQYGHFKNLSFVSFFGDTLLAAGLAAAWDGAAGTVRLRFGRSAAAIAKGAVRIAAAAVLAAAMALTARNSLQAFRWYWIGFTWNMPADVVEAARAAARIVPAGAAVALASDARYPLVPGSTIFRPITLAFHFETDAVNRWTKRLAAILAAELAGRNFYTPGGTTAFPGNTPGAGQEPDYVILGRTQDPRLRGFLPRENLLPPGAFGLFANRRPLILTSADIARASDGSRFIDPSQPFRATIAAEGVRPGGMGEATRTGAPVQALVGLVNTADYAVDVSVRAGARSVQASLVPGVNWAVLEAKATPYELEVRPGQPGLVELVLLRAFDPALGVPTGWTSEPSATISVRAEAQGDTITAVIAFINPAEKGVGVGVTYREDETQGFWVSSAAMPAKAQEIRIEYRVSTREVVEYVNGRKAKSSTAREAPAEGRRRFELAFAHGSEMDYRLTLFEYEWRNGRAEVLGNPLSPYVFDLVDR